MTNDQKRRLASLRASKRTSTITRERVARAALQKLSSAEADVFRLLVIGMSAQKIAVALDLSPFTVSNHTRKIFDAFGTHKRAEVIALFVTPPPPEWYDAR